MNYTKIIAINNNKRYDYNNCFTDSIIKLIIIVTVIITTTLIKQH